MWSGLTIAYPVPPTRLVYHHVPYMFRIQMASLFVACQFCWIPIPWGMNLLLESAWF